MDQITEMITISQAAKLLGVHPDTLRRWEKAGKLTPIRFVSRGHRRYRVDEIMSLIKNNTQQEANPSPTLERLLAMGVRAVIRLAETDKILLIQDLNQDEWQIPHGKLNRLEDPRAGLIREAEELVGPDNIEGISLLRYWHFSQEQKGGELIGLTFSCQTKTKKIKLPQKYSQYRWVDLKEALKLVTNDKIRGDINKFYKIT